MGNTGLKIAYGDTTPINVPKINMNLNLRGNRNPYAARPDSLLSRMKKGYSNVKDFKDSYDNFGITGLLGHYMQKKNTSDKFTFDGPGAKLKYNFPKGSAFIGPDDHGGAKVGLNYEF